MKILLINEYKSCGGAEQIVKNQIQLFKNKGHTVKTLVFSYDPSFKSDDEDYYIISNNFPINKIIFNINYYLKIRNFIKEFDPNIILVHNCFSSPITQYRALKGFNAYQIIHDYSVVCPTSWCVDNNGNGSVCKGYKTEKCLKKCAYHNSKLKLILKLYLTKRCEKLRKKYISLCIPPSERLNEYLKFFDYKSVCINNPLGSIPDTLPDKALNKPYRYIYAGAINSNKGIVEFAEVFLDFSKDKNVILDIYGKAAEENIGKQIMDISEKSNGKINFWGHLSNEAVREKIIESDYMIVPSKCMENYPTVVLEAMALGTVVIGSDRGGIPEMLSNSCGYVYKYGDTQSLISVLNRTYDMNLEDYSFIRQNAFNMVSENNNYKIYYYKINQLM